MSSDKSSRRFHLTSQKTIKDIQTLYTDYDPTSHQIRLDTLKPLFKDIVDTQDIISEGNILKTSENFGEIYGMFEITSEIFHIFSLCYKQVKNLSQAKKLAKKSLSFIEKSQQSSKILPKYLIYLASILSAQKLFHKSLKVLKISRKKLKSLMPYPLSSDKDFLQLFIINIYNIAVEEESLDDVYKSFKHYHQCRDLIMKYKPNISLNLIKNISQGIARLEIYNKPIKHNQKASTAPSSGFHSKKNSDLLNSKKNIKPLLRVSNKSKQRSEDLNFHTRQRIIIKDRKNSYAKNKPSETSREQDKEKKFKYLEGFDKPNHFELSQTQRISFKSELVEKKASLSISDTNSLNFAPIVKDESNDRISDCSEIEEFDVKNIRKISETLQRALSRTLSFGREERLSDASIKTDDVEKVNLANCVMVDELEIDAEFYKTYFQIAEDGKLLVTCRKGREVIYGCFNIPEGKSIIEYINGHVKKSIAKINNQLELLQEKTLIIVKGKIDTVESNYAFSIQLERLYPRWTIEVKIGGCIKSFEIKEIFTNMKPENQSLVLKNPSIMITFFTLNKNNIELKISNFTDSLTLFDDEVSFTPEQKAIKIQISKFTFNKKIESLNTFSYIYMIKSVDEEYLPLIVDPINLKNLFDKINIFSDTDAANVITKNLRINGKQIEIDRDKIQEQFFIERKKKNEIITKNLENDIDQMKKIEKIVINIDSKNSSNNKQRANRNKRGSLVSFTDSNKVILSGKIANFKNMGQRIFMRYSVYEFGQVFQIYMKCVSEKIISFYVSKGIDSDDMRKFSVDLTLIYKALGLEIKNIFYVGWYLIRYHLIIKSIDVCYLDITSDLKTPINSSEKLIRLVRRYFSKKSTAKHFDKLITKKKVKLDGVVYTALAFTKCKHQSYQDKELLYENERQENKKSRITKEDDQIYSENKFLLRLVKRPDICGSEILYHTVEVLGLDLYFSTLVKYGLFKNPENFFKDFKELGISIDKSKGSKRLICLERYSKK